MNKFLDEKINIIESLQKNSGKNKKKKTICDKIIISVDSTWKGYFDLLLLLTSGLNIFGNAYLAAFDIDENLLFIIVD